MSQQIRFRSGIGAARAISISGLVEWKPQAISADEQRALAAAYVDARREYEDRLDQVYPELDPRAAVALLTGGQGGGSCIADRWTV